MNVRRWLRGWWRDWTYGRARFLRDVDSVLEAMRLNPTRYWTSVDLAACARIGGTSLLDALHRLEHHGLVASSNAGPPWDRKVWWLTEKARVVQ